MQPRWVHIEEYANTPVLVLKSSDGTPCDEWMKLNVAPTGSAASFTIFLPLDLAALPDDVAAFDEDSVLPAIEAAAASTATIAVRNTLRR